MRRTILPAILPASAAVVRLVLPVVWQIQHRFAVD